MVLKWKPFLAMGRKKIQVSFDEAGQNATFSVRRLRVEKQGTARPGQNFTLSQPASVQYIRDAYEFPSNETVAAITWDA